MMHVADSMADPILRLDQSVLEAIGALGAFSVFRYKFCAVFFEITWEAEKKDCWAKGRVRGRLQQEGQILVCVYVVSNPPLMIICVLLNPPLMITYMSINVLHALFGLSYMESLKAKLCCDSIFVGKE